MDIKFKTKEIARKFMETIKHNYDNAISCEEFGMWFPVENCHIEENFFRQKYVDQIGAEESITICVHLCDNIVTIESVEEHKEFYVYYFYNEFRNEMLSSDFVKLYNFVEKEVD